MRVLWLAAVLALPTMLVAQTPAKKASPAKLPRVLLLGGEDYAFVVAKNLAGTAEVVVEVFDPSQLMDSISSQLQKCQPDVIHVDRGNGSDAARLDELVVELRRATPNVVLAMRSNALTTDAGPDVIINDLERVARGNDASSLQDALANAVTDVVRRQLYLRDPKRRAGPASGPAAVTEYKKKEAAADDQVPEYFRALEVPEMPLPKDATDWQRLRPSIRQKVIASLGDMPPRPSPPAAQLVSAEIHREFLLERLQISNGLDGVMSAMILIPRELRAPAPTILWLHSSSYDHRQLLQDRSNGGDEPLGLTFVKRGYVVFAPDAAFYGDRVGAGPSGKHIDDVYKDQQADQHKFHLWFGRTLWGMFVRDDQCALDYLCTRPEVDTSRIGATGISMGSTRSWWLAAVDDRIAAAVGVACLTRYENLIHHGNLRAHGFYYFVFGLLKHFDTEAVISLIAPRPMLFLTGELDYGSPADGIIEIERRVDSVYQTIGADGKFRSVRYPEVGHAYTPEMRREMLAWFDRWLN